MSLSVQPTCYLPACTQWVIGCTCPARPPDLACLPLKCSYMCEAWLRSQCAHGPEAQQPRGARLGRRAGPWHHHRWQQPPPAATRMSRTGPKPPWRHGVAIDVAAGLHASGGCARSGASVSCPSDLLWTGPAQPELRQVSGLAAAGARLALVAEIICEISAIFTLDLSLHKTTATVLQR